MLVFQLDQDDRPAPVDLVGGDDRDQLLPVTVHSGLELWVIFADAHARLESQPDGVAAAVPLGADIRANPHNRI